mgnify:CR=1 FL=1
MKTSATSHLRILVIFPNIPLFGQERANIETIFQLKQQGAHVRFLIRKDWTDRTIQPELKDRNISFEFMPFLGTVRYGVNLKTWLYNIINFGLASWAVLRHIRAFRATHIHAGSTWAIMNIAPALCITNIPLIFRAGDIPSQHHWLWKLVWSFTVTRASLFVCDSEFIRGQLISMGAPESLCSVIYAPPPHRLIDSQDQETVKRKISFLPFKHDTTFLYIGQISEDKGVHHLVDAARDLINLGLKIRVLIAGDWQYRNPFAQALYCKIEEEGLANRIVFLGYISSIEPLYQVSDIHVAPTISQEPYGLTVLEAKQHGAPSIVYPSGGMCETVADTQEGLVCKTPTINSLKEAMKSYINNPELVKLHGVAAFLSLTERLKVQDFGTLWSMVYLSTLK